MFITNIVYTIKRKKTSVIGELPVTFFGLALMYQWWMMTDSSMTRETAAILLLLVGHKFVQNLKMVDEIAPLISIITKIFDDIRYFMFILILCMFLFAQCFRMFGLNQIEYDNANPEDIPYRTYLGALWYQWNLMLGDFDDKPFGEDGAYTY